MAALILGAQAVAFRYAGSDGALNGADLAVPRGGKLALLGANGAGKTTLLLHLNGTLRPRSGAILLDGRPVAYDRRFLSAWRQRVGTVLQDPDDQLFSASVYEDVSFGPLNLGLGEAEARRRIDDALAAMGIPHLADRPTHMLSFGQRKRVAIAGVVAMHPEVLVLDEPLAGLDPQGAKDLLALLDRLHAAGTAIVFSTHDVDLAHEWADEVAILESGRVVRQGPATAVLDDTALLARAHLRRPFVLEVAAALGMAEAPRSREALLAGLHERSAGALRSLSPPMAGMESRLRGNDDKKPGDGQSAGDST